MIDKIKCTFVYIVSLLLLLAGLYGCTPHEFVAGNQTDEKSASQANGTETDSSLIHVPESYKQSKAQAYGFGLGVVFGTLGYLLVNSQSKATETHNPELEFLGWTIGFFGGYFIGKELGTTQAEKEYRRKIKSKTKEIRIQEE